MVGVGACRSSRRSVILGSPSRAHDAELVVVLARPGLGIEVDMGGAEEVAHLVREQRRVKALCANVHVPWVTGRDRSATSSRRSRVRMPTATK
jgi:hypothetical protein